MRLKPIFLLIIFFLAAPIFADNQLTAASQLSQLLNQFTTMKADFTQKTIDAEQRVLANTQGKMMLKRPNQFYWETSAPSHQIVITDGNVLWIYDIDLKQATKQQIQNMPISPAQLLSGNIDELLKKFNVRLIPHDTVLVFQLTPKVPDNDFRSIALAFSNEKLITMHLENNAGQISQFQFSHVELDTQLPSNAFQLKLPSDVEIMQGQS